MPAGPPGSEAHPLEVALRLLYADAPAEIAHDPRTWPRWAALLPHVLAATAHLDREPAPAAELLADTSWLLDLAGTYLLVHARLDDALTLFERALTINETTYGPNHPTVAIRLSNLAWSLRDQGHPDQAQPLYERALAIYETTYGPEHPHVATTLNNLAMTLRAQGHPDQAQPLLERALAITETAYGPDHPTVAIRLNNLAGVLRDLGRPEEARTLAERARAIRQRRRSLGATTTYGDRALWLARSMTVQGEATRLGCRGRG
jgi:tetratricopeptide (TPR) repeat protein